MYSQVTAEFTLQRQSHEAETREQHNDPAAPDVLRIYSVVFEVVHRCLLIPMSTWSNHFTAPLPEMWVFPQMRIQIGE